MRTNQINNKKVKYYSHIVLEICLLSNQQLKFRQLQYSLYTLVKLDSTTEGMRVDVGFDTMNTAGKATNANIAQSS